MHFWRFFGGGLISSQMNLYALYGKIPYANGSSPNNKE